MKRWNKMRRMLCCILTLVLMMSVMPLGANALEMEIVHFEDGSYVIIQLDTYGTRASGTVSGSKTANYYSSSNVLEWKAELNGSFSYTGASASCTTADLDITIYNSTWSTQYGYASKSGNKATASGAMLKKAAGITVVKSPINITLTCDANGNLS